MPTRLSAGSLSLVLDLTVKKGFGQPYSNWSGAEAALLMSLKQGETSSCPDGKAGLLTGRHRASLVERRPVTDGANRQGHGSSGARCERQAFTMPGARSAIGMIFGSLPVLLVLRVASSSVE